MINYSALNIQRAIMHKIISKTNQEDSHTECSDSLISLDDDIKSIFRSRLSDAFGTAAKSLRLTINRIEPDSAFGYINRLHNDDDATFITDSKELAEMLANEQNRKNIPSGFLIILDAIDAILNQEVEVLIKAESQTAFNIGRHMSIQAVKDIIMSPASKLYKAASFIKTANNGLSSDYEVWLFDEQFTTRSSLAEYFYKGFLGLSVNDNDKALTKMFFEGMAKTIKSVYAGDKIAQANANSALLNEMNNQERTISPRNTIDRIIQVNDRDIFYEKCITEDTPTSFGKDTSFITSKISVMRYDLPQSFKCSFPYDNMNNIEIDRDSDEHNVIIKIAKD